MTKDEAFALWASKAGMDDGHLPWETSRDLLKTVFTAGWDAKVEADKQTDLPFTDTSEVPLEPEVIYAAYPRKVGRAAAIAAIKKAMTKVSPAKLLEAVNAYDDAVRTWAPTARYTAAGVDTVPHPATWFNQERWTDDRSEWQKGAMKSHPSQFGRTYP